MKRTYVVVVALAAAVAEAKWNDVDLRDVKPVQKEVRTVPGKAASLLPPGKRWKLVWNDEFDQKEIDKTKWMCREAFWGRDFPATQTCSAKPAQWDLAALEQSPQDYASGYPETNGVKSIFFDGEPYKGKATRVFAYLAVPKWRQARRCRASYSYTGASAARSGVGPSTGASRDMPRSRWTRAAA